MVSTREPLPHTAYAVFPLPPAILNSRVEGSFRIIVGGSFPSLRAGREGAPSGAEGWGSAEINSKNSILINHQFHRVLLEIPRP